MSVSPARYDRRERRVSILMQWLTQAAEQEGSCPSNDAIAERLGLASVGSASEMVGLLERRDLIRVARFGMGRVVTIVATGKSTAPLPKQHKHWCERGIVRKMRPRPDRMVAGTPTVGQVDGAFRGDYPDHLRVDRDACPNCGVRADIGCPHSRNRIVTGAFGL